MNSLKVGFSRMDVTPMLGVSLAGYYVDRYADNILDPLELTALALEAGGKRIVMMSLDNLGREQDAIDGIRRHVAEVTGLEYESCIFACTHTHLAPNLRPDSENPLDREYYSLVRHRCADAARFALADLKPAEMGYGTATAPNIAFIRRFRMKDGSVATNPGLNNPNIAEPIGIVDEGVSVLRFDREDGETMVLVNFGNHPDVIGGTEVSADWPGFLRRTLEKALDHTHCIFFNGFEGDLNHVNVFADKGQLNGLSDDSCVPHGYAHSQHIGRVVAGAVLQIFDKVNYVDVDSVRVTQKTVEIPSNRPTPEELELAKKYYALHVAGKDDEIPYQDMMLTTVVAEATRMVRLADGPDAFPLYMTCLTLGPVALLGIAGEPFGAIGQALKKANGWDMVIPCCLMGGMEGYFPMEEAYQEGGYEARSSKFKPGVGELLIQEGLTLLEKKK